MKTKYNKIIERILMVILIIPLLELIALGYVIKVVAKLVEVAQVVVECSIACVRTIFKRLVEALSAKD